MADLVFHMAVWEDVFGARHGCVYESPIVLRKRMEMTTGPYKVLCRASVKELQGTLGGRYETVIDPVKYAEWVGEENLNG